MFGFELENDEWVVAIAVVWLVLRVLYGISRVVWGYIFDIPASPFGGGMGIGIFLLFLTPVAVAAMAIALASITTCGPRQNLRVVVYSVAGAVGFILGIMLEVHIISNWLYKFSLWLASFQVPRYREQLQSGNSTDRLDAAERLTRVGTYARSAWDELLVALRDESADVRAVCARTIVFANPKPPPAEDRDTPIAARTALTDPDFRVRAAAAAILLQFRVASPGEVLPAFIEGLTQGDDQTAFVALAGLTLLGPDAAPACPAMRDAILKRPAIMGGGFAIFQAIGAPAVPMLIEILGRGDFGGLDFGMKLVAIDTLGKIGEPARAALPVLRMLALQDPTLKGSVAKTIRKLGGDIA